MPAEQAGFTALILDGKPRAGGARSISNHYLETFKRPWQESGPCSLQEGRYFMTASVRLCSCDIGSNAIKTRIVEAVDGVLRTLLETRYPIRLGASVFESDSISREAIDATVDVFSQVAEQGRLHAVLRTRIVATSATRDAGNSDKLIEAVRQATGLEIEVISGREEARLLACGVRPDMRPGIPNLVLDVGGGSTEVICTDADLSVESMHSVHLGAVRLLRQSGHAGNGPIGPDVVESMEEDIRAVLGRFGLPAMPVPPFALGAAGTMTAILAAVKQAGHREPDNGFTEAELGDLLRRMCVMTPAEIGTQFGLDLERAQVIVPGVLIVAGLMDFYALDRVTITSRGLRDGIIADMLAQIG